MEIDGNKIMLSPLDVTDAYTASQTMADREFRLYAAGLHKRLLNSLPPSSSDQMDASRVENTDLLFEIPYSERVVTALGSAIKRGSASRTGISD